jgi:hypothetical protein
MRAQGDELDLWGFFSLYKLKDSEEELSSTFDNMKGL